MKRLAYYRRIFASYILKKNSQLTFWHETPAVNKAAFAPLSTSYYMTFAQKADYPGPFDEKDIPLLDYHGQIGKQYNPIAIAQYGLGNFNLWQNSQNKDRCEQFISVADWLVQNLEINPKGCHIWNHYFDWEYFNILKSPWYSALAQGQGISVLTRAYKITNNSSYLESAQKAFNTLITPIEKGGVLFIDSHNDWWLEEYIVSPPTHILNGFIWALWGVYDYMNLTEDQKAKELWNCSLKTLQSNLHRYDNKIWSLYDLSPTIINNTASHFYHSLHIVQLKIMHRLTGMDFFAHYAYKWQKYKDKNLNVALAKISKIFFKLLYF